MQSIKATTEKGNLVKKLVCLVLLAALLSLQPPFLFSPAPVSLGASRGGGQENRGAIKAFPGAEGFGAWSKGGRGGKVYHVTTLADNGYTNEEEYLNSLAGLLK